MNKSSVVVSESYKNADITGRTRSFPFYNNLNLLRFYTNSYASLNNETEILNYFNFKLAFTNV
jgi:hypothetical protein